MSRAIGSWILLNILLACCRGRFFRSTFWSNHQRRWFLVISCISGWILALFPFLSDLWLTWLHYATYTLWWTRPQAMTLLWAMLCIPLIIFFLVWRLPTALSTKILIQLLLVSIGVLLTLYYNTGILFLSRILVACIEERTKTTTNLALHDSFSRMSSDIIFFWLISALGFAVIENFIYLRNVWSGTIPWARWLILKRMFTAWIMHLSYTWLIAIGISLVASAPKKRLHGSMLICCGIGVHAIFNSVLHEMHSWVAIILIVFGYFFLSRLLYQSERVYIE